MLTNIFNDLRVVNLCQTFSGNVSREVEGNVPYVLSGVSELLQSS
jgi:hypothetical protein